MPLNNIVVVGASLAGLRAVETLRSAGFDGRLTLVGAEAHLPYDRPPLSKEVLRGEWEPARIALRRQDYAALDLDLRLSTRAVALDLPAREVVVGGGERIGFDGLIIATGTAPRAMPGAPSLAGLHLLRTLDDALAIRAALERGPRVAVIGAGFIGAEVAASCRARGLDVALVDPQPAPLALALGADMARVCAELHRDGGVELRFGVGVRAIEGQHRVERVTLTDGSRLDTDLVIVGIGVTPVTDWLADSGLDLTDGVACDATCATGVPGVMAAGDVARAVRPPFGEAFRVEHWTNAVEQGVAAARNLLAGPRGAKPVVGLPSFWSDQYGVKIQFCGRPHRDAEIRIVDGDPAARRFVALYGYDDRVVGVLAFGRARLFVKYSEMIGRRDVWADAGGGVRSVAR